MKPTNPPESRGATRETPGTDGVQSWNELQRLGGWNGELGEFGLGWIRRLPPQARGGCESATRPARWWWLVAVLALAAAAPRQSFAQSARHVIRVTATVAAEESYAAWDAAKDAIHQPRAPLSGRRRPNGVEVLDRTEDRKSTRQEPVRVITVFFPGT